MDLVDTTGVRSSDLNGWGRGYGFSVDSADVWVTQVAWSTATEGHFAISLWDIATQAQLARVDNLGGSVGLWSTADIAPVALTQGGAYAITLYSADADLFWSSQADYIPASDDISFLSARYCQCNTDGFPDLVFADYNYGFVDIGYQIGEPEPSPVPLPAGLPMLGFAVAALVTLRRRRCYLGRPQQHPPQQRPPLGKPRPLQPAVDNRLRMPDHRLQDRRRQPGCARRRPGLGRD